MNSGEVHISDEDLLRAADGELSTNRVIEIQRHLTACWSCRTRTQEIDCTIADFIRVRSKTIPELPPIDGPRALLKLRLAELAASQHLGLWHRIKQASYERRLFALALAGAVIILLGVLVFRSRLSVNKTVTGYETLAIPDPNLTPGMTLPVTMSDVCASGTTETLHLVPKSVASQVFAAYGIREPKPHAYELDYLISPSLGGSDNIRNFWPQPYGGTVWNAHIKDALEDHLYRMVCEGKVDLAKAQRDIATDWISAYKKYFQTTKPLPEHASFLKDQPWG